jgi:hypothetical protein
VNKVSLYRAIDSCNVELCMVMSTVSSNSSFLINFCKMIIITR